MESDEESEELVYYQLIFGFLTCVQAFLYWRMFCVARSGDDETQLTAATACSSFMDVASLGRVILFLGCHKYSLALWIFAGTTGDVCSVRRNRCYSCLSWASASS